MAQYKARILFQPLHGDAPSHLPSWPEKSSSVSILPFKGRNGVGHVEDQANSHVLHRGAVGELLIPVQRGPPGLL